MKKKSLLLIPLILILGVATFSLHQFVTAQSAGQGLEVSPPSQEASIDPGKTTTVKAKIRNRSNNALPVSVRIEDFMAKGDQGQVELSADSPYSITNWTKVTPNKF